MASTGIPQDPTLTELKSKFYGGDPVVGREALHQLLKLGADADAVLLSFPVASPPTTQVRRRLLQYVATRWPDSEVRLRGHLGNGLANWSASTESALLYAGMPQDPKSTDALYLEIEREFDTTGGARCWRPRATLLASYEATTLRLIAYAAAGGLPGVVWDAVRSSDYTWGKMRKLLFNAACLLAARVDDNGFWLIEKFLTCDRDRQLVEWFADSGRESQLQWGPDSLASASLKSFRLWRRGAAADAVLKSWSGSSNRLLRCLGAFILRDLAFQRCDQQVLEWLAGEEDPLVRQTLFDALETGATPQAADALLNAANQGHLAAVSRLATVAPLCTDRRQAVAALFQHCSEITSDHAPALVSLARMETAHPKLQESLKSRNEWIRTNAALAAGYLQDSSFADALRSMRRESSSHLERIAITTALTMMRQLPGSQELQTTLVKSATGGEGGDAVDFFQLRPYLQQAILAGLEAAAATDPVVIDAWRTETDPFEANPRVHVVARPPGSHPGSESNVVPVPATSVRDQGQTAPPAGDAVPVRHAEPPTTYVPGFQYDIFISYARDNNGSQPGGPGRAWVTRFRLALEHLVNEKLEQDGKIRVFFDDGSIGANQDLEGTIREAIHGSALLLTVLSPRYLNRRWCLEELEQFVAAAGGMPGAASRVFLVLYDGVSPDRYPASLKNHVGIEFYFEDPVKKFTSPLQPENVGEKERILYFQRLHQLRHEVAAQLNSMRRDRQSGARPPDDRHRQGTERC